MKKLLIVAAFALALAGCGGVAHHAAGDNNAAADQQIAQNVADAAHQARTTAPPTTEAPAATVPPTTAPPTTQAPTATTAPPTTQAPTTTHDSNGISAMGTPVSVADNQANSATVTLVDGADPANITSSFETAPAGSRFVAYRLSITGVQGTFSDDEFLTVKAGGSDHQVYQPDMMASGYLAGCTDFDSGQYSVTPGQTEQGCVAFAIPDSVQVSSIEFDGASFMYGNANKAVWSPVSPA